MIRFDGVEPIDLTDHVAVTGQPTAMSKRMVRGGDAAGLPTRFSQSGIKRGRELDDAFLSSSSVRPVSTGSGST